MPNFVKLDTGILVSTLWNDRDVRDVFLTALLMAEPWETKVPMPQIEVDALKETGWLVPPGWYGFVPAAGPGIVHRSLVGDRDRGMAALRVLGEPDRESRTPDHDGRRLVRVDGGYVVLNYIRYRDRDYTTAERSRRWRERKRLLAESQQDTVAPLRHAVTSRIGEGDADGDGDSDAVPLPPAGLDVRVHPSRCTSSASADHRQDDLPPSSGPAGGRGTAGPSQGQEAIYAALWATSYRRNAKQRQAAIGAAAKRLAGAGILPKDLMILAERAASKGAKPAGLFAHWIDQPNLSEALKELGKR